MTVTADRVIGFLTSTRELPALQEDTALLSDGTIDSVGMIELIRFLESFSCRGSDPAQLPPAQLSSDAAPSGSYQLSGPLCTSVDVLARAVALSRLEAGDLIAIETSGACGPSASPGRFISHPAVAEWIVEDDEVRPAGSAPG
jgi:Pyridoxal-dependent decarboxylase, C-terminal sheet domain